MMPREIWTDNVRDATDAMLLCTSHGANKKQEKHHAVFNSYAHEKLDLLDRTIHLLLQQVVSRPESHPQLCVGHAHMWMVQGASNSVSHRHVVTLHHNSMRLAKRCKLTRLPASASLAPSSLLTTLPPTSPVPMEAARATAGLEGPLDDAPLELLAFADYPGPASGNACRIATICSNSLSESFLALDFKR